MIKTKKKTASNKKTPAKRSSGMAPTDRRAVRVIGAVTLALLLVMIALACISYLFTGAGDQSVQPDERYGNLLGKAGYFLAHALMSRMGLATFFILTVGFALTGILALDKPFSRIALFCAKTIGAGLWLSVLLAYFSSEYSGAWGYRLNDMLQGYIGWGLAILLALFPIVWAILRYGITPEKLNQVREQRLAEAQARRAEAERLRAEKEDQLRRLDELKRDADKPHSDEAPSDDFAVTEEEDPSSDEDDAMEPLPDSVETFPARPDADGDPCYEGNDDGLVSADNSWSYADGQQEDELSDGEAAPDVFPDDDSACEEGMEGQNAAYAVEDRCPDVPSSGLPAEGQVLHEREGDVECTVSIASAEGELDEDLAERIVAQYGEYDPKLELSGFEFPPLSLLRKLDNEGINVDKDEVTANRRRIVETLKNYNIDISHIHSTIGPTVTLYEIIPAPGVKVSKIKSLEDDIALSLSALGIRIIAPIPGRGTIGIEVPNKEPSMVSMNAVVSSAKFQTAKMELPVAIGKNISNETVVFDLAKMPHLLMAGATGQGKSVGLNAVLASLLYKKHPSQVKFVLVDPKKVELTLYNKIERHYLAKLPDSQEAIITDTAKVVNTLNSLCMEMDARYDLLKDAYVRNIKEYNAKFVARRLNPEKGHRYLPYIVLVVDEFADLIMTAGKEVEMPIARLAQLARAVGIHLIIATQRPSVNVITGLIKANFPARIAFRVTSKIDSRTILDASGAEQLIGKGDMLLSANNVLTRVQCAFIDTPEVEEICEFIGAQKAYPHAFLLPEYNGDRDGDGTSGASSGDPMERDPKFEEAARIVVALQQGSASVIQRKMAIGFNRAGRIVDQLEAAGVIGPFNGSKAREVLIQDEASLNRLLYGADGPVPQGGETPMPF